MVTDNETLVERIRSGYSVSENMQLLYEKNLPLIKRLIVPYVAYEPMEDLLQEAYFGLVEAVRHYESSRNVLFMTYAKFWIKQAVIRYLDNYGSTVRLPVHVREKMNQCRKAADQIRREQRREPHVAEIAALSGLSSKEVQELRTYAQGVDSLDVPISEDESLTLADKLQSDSSPENEVVNKIYDEHSKNELWGVLARYTSERENETIKEIFLYGKSMAQVAREQGVSLDRIRQIKENGLRKLKRGKALCELMEKFEIAEASLYRGGLSNYRQHNFNSIVEYIVTREVEARERYEQILKEIEEMRSNKK